MTYLVNKDCVNCKHMDCVEVCPVDCFYEGENMLVINPDECIDCGVCVPECPVDAIIEESQDDGTWFNWNSKYSVEWPQITQKRDEDVLADTGGIDIKGTRVGQDPDTQITTLIAGDVISVRRSVNDSVRLDLNGNDAYTLIIIQDGVSNVVKINGGGDSVITITQSE